MADTEPPDTELPAGPRAREATARSEIDAAVNELKARYPLSGQNPLLYREACEILLLRFGLMPNGNRLFQLVGRGSMQTVNKALAEFVESLRTRLQLGGTDAEGAPSLPAELGAELAKVAQQLFKRAVDQAESNFQAARDEAERKVTVAEEKRAAADQLAETLMRELDGVRAANAALESRIAAEVSARAEEVRRREGLERALASQTQAFENERSALSEKLATTEATLSEERSRALAEQERLEKLHKEFERELLDSRDLLAKKDKAIAEERQAFKITRETLESLVHQTQEHAAQAREQAADATARVDELRKRLTALEASYAELGDAHRKAQDELTACAERRSALEVTVANMQDTIRRTENECAAARAEVERLQQELSAARQPQSPSKR